MLKTVARRAAWGVSRGIAVLALVLLLAIAFGGLMSAFAAQPSPGRLVDIGGRKLNLVCAGPEKTAGPLVVFEAGAFGLSADFGAVQE
ncbi:MAG: hypothetical protein EON95_19440, partial [Caulobacteraceae bacterium]